MNDLIECLPEITLKILGSIRYKYPWKTLRFIFINLKLLSRAFYNFISYNEANICIFLEIPQFHFLAGLNRDNEIINLFNFYDDRNQGLRAPDKWGYSPANYACANHARKTMHILKIGYSLNTEELPSESLHKLMKSNKINIFLVDCDYNDELHSTEELANYYCSNDIDCLKHILTFDTYQKDDFLEWDEIKHRIKSSNCKLFDKLLIFAYKTFLVKKFWDIAKGYDYGNAGNTNYDELDIYSDNNINFNTCDENGNTFLHHAIVNSMENVVHFLLKQKNINVNIRNIYGFTPLTYAQNYGSEEHIDYNIKILIESGNLVYDDYNFILVQIKNLPEHLILILENCSVIKIEHFIVLLCYVIKWDCDTEIIKIFADKLKISIPIVNNKINVIKLFENDYLRELIFQYEKEIIEICIKNNLLEYLEIILKRNSTLINEKNEYTSLHLAIIQSSTAIVRLLLDYGADKNLRTISGLTAKELAIMLNRNDIAEIL